MIRGGFGHGEERPQVDRERSAAVAILGLPGLVMLAVSEHDGEVEQAIETTAGPGEVPSVRGHGRAARPPPGVRTGPTLDGRSVTLVWAKRTWRHPHRCVRSEPGPRPARRSR